MGLSLKGAFLEEGTEQMFTVEKRKKVIGGTRGLNFDNKIHQYTMNGVVLLSATSIISRFTKPFEAVSISRFVAAKNKKADKKYMNNDVKVRRYWKVKGERASALGTSGHAFCEMQWLNPEDAVPIHEVERNAKKLMDKLKANFYIMNMEVNRGNDKYKIGYTIDIELQSKKTGDYILGDFKFSGNFTAGQYKKSKGRQANYMSAPFRDLGYRVVPEDKGYIQLNMYKRFFEIDTGIKVAKSLLFHIDGLGSENYYGDAGYKVYVVPDLTEQVDVILKPHENIKYDILKKL